jgi:oligopeptide/dipeptide ABC transporter ATP-binding protein
MTAEKEVILRVEELRKYYPVNRGWFKAADAPRHLKAVDGVSFDLKACETLGLVGESGCGKTTTGRVILGLEPATAGRVFIHTGGGSSEESQGEVDLCALSGRAWMPWRRRVQMIFQDPYSSLNPRMTVGSIVGEPLDVHNLARGAERRRRVLELFDQVGLPASAMDRFPHEFSGGQRQRVGVARALAVQPDIIIADEPVSALDVSIQAQIINLLQELQERHGLSFIFISHALSVVGHISHRVAVMYLGRIVEMASKADLFEEPLHPYTRALLGAAPKLDPKARGERVVLKGDIPSPISPPSGCPFHPRCPERFEGCDNIVPQNKEVKPGRFVACRLYEE